MTMVAVHGGVSGADRSDLPSLASALAPAMETTHVLDAVELAVRALENDPALNAGFGAVLNLEGELELDAGIVEGTSGRWAGVANVAVRHPISLARRVLEQTPHVLVTGRGAAALASGMETLEDTTDSQRRRWIEARADGRLAPEHFGTARDVDTVGAVALDDDGHLAAGSSTGGVFGKMPGRVGDSPIYGAGLYASRRAAVVGTGIGELFLEALACLRTGELIDGGLDPQRACERIVEAMGTRSDATAGLLALDSEGHVGAAFRGASWALEGPDGPISAARSANRPL
jgi:beta-aspartyl-peptidase (threonine type)